LTLSNVITWKKKRAYGVQHNYLFTREELLYLVNGDAKKPRRFNVPLLAKKRGYAGYDPAHPAKSEYLRRSNVWVDIDAEPEDGSTTDVWDATEVLRGKLHECQKADRVCEIPIEVHTDPGEVVVELFGGSASTAAAAQRLGRRFVVVESGAVEVENIIRRIG
jgi:DNA modification methylase